MTEEEKTRREEFIERMKSRLDKWNEEIANLEEKAKEASGEAREEYNRRIEEMKQKRDEVDNRLGEIRSASADAWETFRQGTEDSMETLKSTIRKTREAFSEKLSGKSENE